MNSELVSETIRHLQITFTHVEKQERENSEKRLTEISSNIQNFTNLVFSEFIPGIGLFSNSKIRQSISIYLKNQIKTRIDQKLFSKEDVLFLIKMYSHALVSVELENSVLLNFTNTTQCLFDSEFFCKNESVINETIDFYENSIQNFSTFTMFKNLVRLFESLILSSSITPENAQTHMTKIFKIVEKILNFVVDEFKQGIEALIKSNKFFLMNEIIGIVFHFLNSSIIKLKSRLNILDKFKVIYVDSFIPHAINIVISKFDQNKEFYIMWTGNQEADQSVNLMKSKCLSFLNMIIDHIKLDKIDSDLNSKVFNTLEETLKNLEFIAQNYLEYIFLSESKNQKYPDYEYKGLIIQMIEFSNKILNKDNFYLIFSKKAKLIFSHIIFPLLMTTKDEIEDTKQNPEFFQVLSHELIEGKKNTEKLIKLQAAIMLKNLVLKYDGLGNYVIKLSIECILSSFVKNTEIKYSVNIQNHSFLNIEQKIDICFLILAIMKNFFNAFPKSLDYIKQFFTKHLQTILQVESSLIQTRICMIFTNHIVELFSNSKNHLVIICQFLFKCLLSYNENNGLAYEAINSIMAIFEAKKLDMTYLNDSILLTLDSIINLIKDVDFPVFFDLLNEIVLKFELDSKIINIFEQLTQRILSELDKKLNSFTNSKDTSYISNRCLNILRSITDSNTYVTIYLECFESILKPLFEINLVNKKANLTEDLIYFTRNFIDYTQAITLSGYKIFDCLIDYLIFNEGISLDLFELLSRFINHGDKFFDVKFTLDFINICKLSFDNNQYFEASPILGGILIQLYLQKYSNLCLEHLELILEFTVENLNRIILELPLRKDDKGKFSDLLNINCLIGIVHSSLLNYPTLTLKYFQVHEILFNGFFLWGTLFQNSKFCFPYNYKISILAFNNILMNNELKGLFSNEFFVQILSYIFVFLEKQKILESRLVKNNNLNFKFNESENNEGLFEDEVDDDENGSDTDEDYDEDNRKNLKIKINMNKLNMTEEDNLKNSNESLYNEIEDYYNKASCISLYTKIDEFQTSFSNYNIFSLKFPEIVDKWKSSYTDIDKVKFESLLHTRRIRLTDGTTSLPRKIIKIKRNSG